MKKGMGFGALIVIVLGFIVLLIILGVFGPQLTKSAKDALAKANITRPEDPGAAVPGTKIRDIPLPEKYFTGTRDEIKGKIVSELFACWNIMGRGNREKEKCIIITFDPVKPKLKRGELVTALKAKSENAAEALDDNWGLEDTINRGDELTPLAYLICADSDWGQDDDLFLTNNLAFDCE